MCSLNGGWIWIEATTGGQKCCDLFSNISETSDPSPPTPNKVEFWANGWNDCFLDTTLLGEWERGDDGMYPKEIKKLSLGAESYLEGLFHTVQSSLIFVLHCRCPFNRGSKYKDYMNIFSGTRFWVPWMGCPKGEVALQCNKLMGMCDWMKSYFCDSGLTQQCYIFNRVTRIGFTIFGNFGE